MNSFSRLSFPFFMYQSFRIRPKIVFFSLKKGQTPIIFSSFIFCKHWKKHFSLKKVFYFPMVFFRIRATRIHIPILIRIRVGIWNSVFSCDPMLSEWWEQTSSNYKPWDGRKRRNQLSGTCSPVWHMWGQVLGSEPAR